MPTVVLGPAAAQDRGVVVPGRFRVELAELVALARAGGHRLPFDVSGVGAAGEERPAWIARLSPEPSPADQLAVLLGEQAAREQVAAADPDRAAVRAAMSTALGVLAGAEVLLEVRLGLRLGPRAPRQARAWVGVRGETVVSLATVSGALFELAWTTPAALPELLAHLVRLPDGPPPRAGEPEPPERFTLPVELMAATGVGAARHREDLLAGLVERFPGAVTGPDGEAYDAGAAHALLDTVRERLTARLRVVVAGPRAEEIGGAAGAVVWMRLGAQWFALDPDQVAGFPVARARAVVPRDLARAVGPVLARVWGRERG
ncbi:hypothetical protein [Nocardioides daeguensis]|uniref:ESX secretion-associated protein EspG n=1 Tax=Nocardioides daeguensis TaxID=908359 RepID=A0ABP6VDG4_9ACTN|nr:hypothetical protein [Nocardioides daeguensis]MBV6729534.1 hypothetical protein [Nocardioides daeguensis]MCR1771693.1 hypothetical protein [Nocardioides daeguensis]